MDKEQLNIFLSASIPSAERSPKYFATADIIAIRDSVIALSSIALTKYKIIWGGHPSITPLIASVMKHYDINVQEHVLLYQSKYFEKKFPPENKQFASIVKTKDLQELDASLLEMRTRMLTEHHYVAGFFIGGMEGIEDEYNLFKEKQPNVNAYPIASTGGGAKCIYDSNPKSFDSRLATDMCYYSLFKELLSNI